MVASSAVVRMTNFLAAQFRITRMTTCLDMNAVAGMGFGQRLKRRRTHKARVSKEMGRGGQ